MAQIISQHDFLVAQGTTWADTIQINNADGTATDLTGYSAMMRLRSTVAGTVKLEASTANGKLTIADPTNGQIRLNITEADTQSLFDANASGPVEYVYELFNHGTDNIQADTLLRGKVIAYRQTDWS